MDIQQETQTESSMGYAEMHHEKEITASEVAVLWNSIIQYRELTLVFDYFAEKVQDPELKNLYYETRDICRTRMEIASDIFKDANIPLPVSIDESDLNINARSLYTDAFYLRYLTNMVRVGININALSLAMTARMDVMNFYDQCVASSLRLNQKVHKLMLDRGMLVRAPYINVQAQPDIIRKPSFLTGFLGEKRPLTTFEIAHLFFNSTTNYVGQVLLTGFAEVCQDKDVKKYMEKGAGLAASLVSTFSTMLHNENLPVTLPWDIGTTGSTEPPFSDKLMMFQVLILNATGVGNYGVSISTSLRHDITLMYTRVLAEVAQFSGEGTRLMMEKGWMEEPPKKTRAVPNTSH